MEEKEDLGAHSCLSTVKFLLYYCNMNDTFLNPTKIKNDTIASKCCNVLMSKYVGFWNNIYTHGNNKLRTFCLIKSEYSVGILV